MMHNSLIDCKKKPFFCVLFFLAVCGCPYIGTNNLFMHRDTIVPHAVMYHLHHEAIAAHLAHDATPVQQSVAPASRVFGPFHEMRIVITDNPRHVDGGLQRALPVFGTVFIHVALVHAAVFIMKGHLISLHGHGNGHRSGGPVVLRLSLSLHSSLFLRSTDGFQMLFEINSIFFILYGVLK